MEQVEEISQRVQLLKKKLAWAHVYDIDDQIQQAEARIEKLKGHIPYCEDLIARQTVKMEGLEDRLAKKKAQIAILMERTSEVRKMKEELQHNRSEATKERSELEQDCIRRVNEIKRIMKRAEMLEQQIRDTSDQDDKHTQAEEHEMEENLSELKKEVEEAVLQFERYKKDEDSLSNSIQFQKVQSEIEVLLKKDQQNRSSIRDLRLHQTNKVTAFGGNRVTNLLRAIERHHYRFGKPPIGPIGAHLGARPATESTAPGSTTGSSWGISSIFGGSDNRVAAKENLTSKPSNEPIQTIEPSSSMIHLGEMLDELPVDADAVERGFSLNAEPTGLPRIHGLPSYSFDSTSRGSTESYTASPKNPRSCKSSHSGELYSSHITAYSNGGGCN